MGCSSLFALVARSCMPPSCSLGAVPKIFPYAVVLAVVLVKYMSNAISQVLPSFRPLVIGCRISHAVHLTAEDLYDGAGSNCPSSGRRHDPYSVVFLEFGDGRVLQVVMPVSLLLICKILGISPLTSGAASSRRWMYDFQSGASLPWSCLLSATRSGLLK